MKIVYFYAKDGKKIGPLSREQLDDLRLKPNTLVWHYGLTDWIPYKDLPKQEIKQEKPSLFDRVSAWLKSKKKESAPKVEAQPTPVVEATTVEPEVNETVEELVAKPTILQRLKQNKNWGKYAIICVVAIILVLMTIWAIGKYNAYKAEKQRQEQIREFVKKGDDAMNNALYELASKYYRNALELDSLSWALNYKQGYCMYKMKKDYTACQYYEKAYLYNPNHNDTVIIVGDTLHYERLLGRYAWAMQECNPQSSKTMELSQEYYSLYPDKSSSYRVMTFVNFYYAQQIKYDTKTKDEYMRKSLQWANKMVRKFPNDEDSYFCLAYIQNEMDCTNQAIANYKKCIDLEPSGSAYNNLGVCYEHIGNYQEAYRCWRKAIELGEDEYAPNNLRRHGQRVE